jgi:hypothetical protein
MKIRLIKRFADAIDGISLARCRIGDVIDLAPHEARVLLDSEWAVIVEPPISNVVDAPFPPTARRSIVDPPHAIHVVHRQTANSPSPDCHD